MPIENAPGQVAPLAAHPEIGIDPPQPFVMPKITPEEHASAAAPQAPAFSAPRPSQPPAPGTVLREFLRKEGLDPGEVDDETLAKTFSNGLVQIQDYEKMRGELDKVSSIANRYYRNAGEFERWAAERDQAAKKPELVDDGGWRAPQYDPEWEELVEVDPKTGKYVVRDPVKYNPAIADRVNDWVKHQREFQREFSTNPIETLNKAGLKRAMEEQFNQFKEQLQQESYWNQRRAIAENFIQTHADKFYEKDQRGHAAVDSMGQPVLSPRGKAFAYYRQMAENSGVHDPVHQQEYAANQLRLLELEYDRASREQQARAEAGEDKGANGEDTEYNESNRVSETAKVVPFKQPQPENKKEKFLDRARAARRVNPRDASISAAAENQIAQNENLDFAHMAFEEARAQGLLPQTG